MRGSGLSSRALIPYVILAASLVLTAATTGYVYRTRVSEARHRFEIAAEDAHRAILSRLDTYVGMLRGGAGLFAASGTVSQEQFGAYVERLELATQYPGIQGIGFSRVVRPEEREEVLAEARRYVPEFEFRPPQEGDINAIVFLEPLDARNRRAIGYDMGSEAVRREAMTRARDTAAPVASGKVRLIQEQERPDEAQAGFLIYVPVYAGGRIPNDTQERRQLLRGFVYSPFRGDDLLGGIIRSDLEGVPAIEVFDGEPGEDRLLHRTPDLVPAPPNLRIARSIDIPGRVWTLVLHGDETEATGRLPLAALVGIGGLLLSASLFAVTRGQILARAEAERTAEILRSSEERLRQANSAKDDFLATVSHELRTPLNAIVGWAAMLERRELPPDMQAHAIRVIARNAAAQTRLVEDLLDMSKALAGHLTLERRPVQVRAVLQGAVETVRPMADSAALRLQARFEEPLGWIDADEFRLQQVLTNLLSNAIKFTSAGGQIVLHARSENATLIVSVTDNGIGIDPAFMPFLFERFRQEDSSSTRRHAGTGLGLAIVQHLISLHGGTITASSPGPGHGATFEFRIPGVRLTPALDVPHVNEETPSLG